jgi:hypothetical protein
MRETTFRRGAPLLEPPHRVLQRLARELLAVGGEVREHVYLNAANAKHRWAMRHFGNVDEEFRFKVVWVAKLLRVLGAIRLMANAHVIASITPDLPYLSAEAEVPYDARGGQSGNA